MPPVTSNARVYFDHIKSRPDPFAFLSAIPSPPRPDPFFEEEWIDFKGRPRDDKDATKIWSKALSGYANITDGLVIWGIDARKTPPRDIDAACGLRLITDPAAFESKLRDWIRDATNPPVMGVEYASFPGPSTEGFVVCLVPESIHRPHRAEWADRNYYYRAGDDFLVAEPGLLRLLFHPRVSPRFRIVTTMDYESTGEHRNALYQFRCYAQISNTGTATAKNVVVAQNWNVPGTATVTADQLWARITGSRYIHAFMTNSDIHPGFYSNFYVTGRWPVQKRHFTYPESGAKVYKPGFEDVVIDYFVFAENFEPQRHRVVFTQDDFLEDKLVQRKADIIGSLGDGVIGQ